MDNSTIIPTTIDGQSELHQLMRGKTQSSGIVLVDPTDQKTKFFFVFPDLAIKSHGDYRIVARLIDVSRFFSLQVIVGI